MLKRFCAIFISVILCLSLLSGCVRETNTSVVASSTSSKSGGTHDDVKGTVKVALPEWNVTDLQVEIGNFCDAYPNVDVEFDTFPSDGGAQAYLTAQAQSNSMPDILVGDWGSLPYSVSQGWVQPLNEFLDADDETQYIPKTLLDDYTYLNKIYALPSDLQFQTVAINLDLLDSLNLDKPDYNWTINDYNNLLKAATTTQYSGTERLWGFDSFMVSAMNANYGYNTYDYVNRTFNFSKAWSPSLKLLQNLRAVPGLEAWALRNSNVDKDKSDYTKKFGEGDTSDMDMAFKTGKVLTESFMITSDASWMRYMNFNWEMFPLPQDSSIGSRQCFHANHSFMLKGAKNPQAAYELLKWLTTGAEGNVKKMEMFANKDKTDLTSGYLWYFPSTKHPDVLKAMADNKNITGGIQYMYDHLDTAVRSDLNKIVPGYDQINSDIIEPIINQARDGVRDASSVAAEMDEKANKQLASSWLEFEGKLEKVQALDK